jgi:hypothetical protein
VDVRGKVVEHADRGEQAQDSVDRLGRDAVVARGAHHLGRVPRTVEQ